jgi:hypothetical protein
MKKSYMIPMIMGVKDGIYIMGNLFNGRPICKIIHNISLSIRQILPQINEDSGLVRGYFGDAAAYLVNAPVDGDVHC